MTVKPKAVRVVGTAALAALLGLGLLGASASPPQNSAPASASVAATPPINPQPDEKVAPEAMPEPNEGRPEAKQLEPTARAIADAITELDVERAKRLFAAAPDGPGLAFQRARLAIYVGDCDSAEATLRTLPESPETLNLGGLARNCARATAGSLVVDDTKSGVWIRLQDSADEALVPLIIEVAERARRTMVEDLGVELPRPLRIDLVRDLFSLASVTGLPLEAAETTGTVAVARWGRVTMISPRAARYGYPWQDTLAHEITHLALSRGSRDYAPLWLQEGIAKREETRWREARPFDELGNPHDIARRALREGTSVGIDRIGPSIAMLPSPQAAAISYAEVESFMDFWIRTLGREAFTLLLLDLKGLNTRDTEGALLSVTGYPLSYWIARWQTYLLELPDAPEPESVVAGDARLPAVQGVRLGDLLYERAQLPLSVAYYDDALTASPEKPAVRFRAAAAQMALGNAALASERLGSIEQISGLHGSWLGLHGRMLQEVAQANDAERAFGLALAVDPIGEEAACEGHSRRTARHLAAPSPSSGAPGAVAAAPISSVQVPPTQVPSTQAPSGPGTARSADLPLPQDPVRRKLCEDARRAARD